MTPAVSWYFRRKFFLGKEGIPPKGPMVIIGTHSGSFLDAIVMGVMLNRPIHYYVRGDIFRKKIVRWIFTQLHMIPVFSADLAKQDLAKNTESFDIGSDILCSGGALLIFPEGLSRLERNFMPFRKSPARVILQALQKNESLHISVVPIGINYTKHSFRSDLQLVTGEVISVNAQSIAQMVQEGEPSEAIRSSKAIQLLTKEMRSVFEPILLYVEDPARYDLVNQQLSLLEAQYPEMTEDKFRRQKEICRRINEMTDVEAEELTKLHLELNGLLSKIGISERALFTKVQNFSLIGLIISLPFFLLGAFLNYIPKVFGQYMADTKVTRKDFYTSVQMAVSANFYFLWLLFWTIISVAMQSFVVFEIVIASIFLGWFSVKWKDEYDDLLSVYKARRLDKNKIQSILSSVQELLKKEKTSIPF